MHRVKITAGSLLGMFFLLVGLLVTDLNYAQTTLLNKADIQSVVTKSNDWKLAGYVWFDPSGKKKTTLEKGTDVLYTTLQTPASFGIPFPKGEALYMECEYMLSPEGELNLIWNRNESLILSNEHDVTSGNGINGTLSGNLHYTPRVTTVREPGLWQHLQMWLSADGTVYGVKINGVVVHRNVRLAHADQSGKWDVAFKARGPVAIRNVQYGLPEKDDERVEKIFDFPTLRKIIVKPEDNPTVQRCFIQDSTFKRTYCVAVGDPSGIHYVIDQTQANILGIWKGEFYDASTMWISRGEQQVAQPLGNMIWFDGKPALAVRTSKETSWPVGKLPGLRIKGYELDAAGRPIFLYDWNGIEIIDQIVPIDNNQSLERTLSFTGVNQKDIWLRIAAGNEIRMVNKNAYAVNDLQYYLQLADSKGIRPEIRKGNGIAELLIPISSDTKITYTLKW